MATADVQRVAEVALGALENVVKAAGAAAAELKALLEEPPASKVELRVVEVTSRSITVEWTWTGREDPAGWTVGRDGIDLNGTGNWATRRPPAQRDHPFTSLRSSTEYTLTVTPDGGDPVSVTATTAGGGTSGPPTELHGPRAIKDGWAAAEIGRDDFMGPGIDPQWSKYNSAGHGGKGLRRPGQWSIVDDPAAIDGRALHCFGTQDGTTGGMAMRLSQRFGRWAIRMRAEGDEHYHQVGLTWPTAENWPAGGEIDFAEGNAARDKMEFFLHYSAKNQQTHGSIATSRRNYTWWELEWTPDWVRGWRDGVQFFEDLDRSHFNYDQFGAHHLCLQLDWFPDGATRTGAAEMFVDAVRVYAHPASVRLRAPQSLLGPAPYSSPVVDRFAQP